MSGTDDPGADFEVPAEYEAVYREAYLRALAEEEAALVAAAPPPPAPAPERSRLLTADDEDEDAPSPPYATLVSVLIAVVLIAGAFGLGRLLSDDDEPANGSPQQSASSLPPSLGEPAASNAAPPNAGDPTPDDPTTPAAGSEDAWEGSVAPVAIAGAESTCTSPPGVDAAGDPVSYEALNAVDTDETTAWRCDGPARRVTLTFRLPTGTEVGEVGLIPGYAKTDAESGTDRYAENNRITRVRWTLGDGTTVVQELDPDPANRSVQKIRVPRTSSDEVTLQILRVERGARNMTAISAVEVGEAQ